MGWFYLILGSLIEIGWAFGLKFTEGFTNLFSTIITLLLIGLSFFFFSLSLKSIPIGVAYAAFTGIGTVGTVIVGVFFLDETINLLKFFFVLLLISGIVGLKSITKDEQNKKEEKIEETFITKL